jgi:hypothetical protein
MISRAWHFIRWLYPEDDWTMWLLAAGFIVVFELLSWLFIERFCSKRGKK